jgi:hypothetical protein
VDLKIETPDMNDGEILELTFLPEVVRPENEKTRDDLMKVSFK